MKYNRIFNLLILAIVVWGGACTSRQEITPEWPEISNETRPWARWWWHGSSVDTANLRLEMEAYKAAGLGGLELTPIFGVIGDEDHFLDYLSPEWMDRFEFALKEAERLGLGMDMATGTGWPFGGPWIGEDNAPKNLVCQTYSLAAGESLKEPVVYIQKPYIRAVRNQLYQLFGIYRNEGEKLAGSIKNPVEINREHRVSIKDLAEPVAANKDLQGLALDQVKFEKRLPLISLMAFSHDGTAVDLTDKVDKNGKLDWKAPDGKWTLYALFQGWHGKMVERAAPGGEGNTIDHFSGQAIRHYLSRFDSAFAGRDISYLRSFFNDSYEVDDALGNADWTPEFLAAFESRRGYDLRQHLPALFSPDSLQWDARILSDYRETLSDLILEKFTDGWKEWAHGKGAIVRNQAHGSPGNILDLYAASDIPETEGTDLLGIKFASSAAHVTGKHLASSESATWLNEHFLSSLADVKANLENYFLGGVNHVLYHGTAYSPHEDAWPGRLFYAAVHLNPRNPLWTDFDALNGYAARVQSFLQMGQPDNDVLLYFPAYDRFADRGRYLIEHFELRGPGFDSSAFKAAGAELQAGGYGFDYISDRQTLELTGSEQALLTGGLSYKTIIVPECDYMPLTTFEKLVNLAEGGATVIFQNRLPVHVAGWKDWENRQKQFDDLKARISFSETELTGVRAAKVGKGAVLLGSGLEELLTKAGVDRENMTDAGLHFTRRSHERGRHYFILNKGVQRVNGWTPLAVGGEAALLFDPATGQNGLARTRISGDGKLEVFLQLDTAQSIIVQTFDGKISAKSFPYYEPAGQPLELAGPWHMRFLAGGPELPAETDLNRLQSWTELDGEAFKIFSGTVAYSTQLPNLPASAAGWRLDLGQVEVSATVWVNGQKAGSLIGPVYSMVLDKDLLKEQNTLEVRVTNLMANRIADLDKRGVFWKKFYNVNFPARLPENRKNGLFDASEWAPLPSGLIGPVTLTPVAITEGR